VLQCRVPEFPIEPDDLRRLARLAESLDLSELRFEEGDLRLTLRTSRYQPPAPTVVAAAPVATYVEGGAYPLAPPEEAEAPHAPSGIAVGAPIMGTFYRAPGPGEPPYVEVGDMVEIDQPIGIIEAMKVLSPVLSDRAGRIKAIPAGNGAFVQAGDPLVILEGE
jgi:acetyl-CoA carboxylase biotin carboxyl carrier protein